MGDFGAISRYVLKSSPEGQARLAAAAAAPDPVAEADATTALADQSDQLSRQCNVPPTEPTSGLTKIPGDGWCFYKAILAAVNGSKNQIYTEAEHDKGKASGGAHNFALSIASTILENPEELRNFEHLFGESIKTNVLDENGNVTENVTLTPDQYLAEMQNPPTKSGYFPRVYGEGVALLQAAARVAKKKIAIYGGNGNLLAVGCPKEETEDVISLKFVDRNHYDVFLPASKAATAILESNPFARRTPPSNVGVGIFNAAERARDAAANNSSGSFAVREIITEEERSKLTPKLRDRYVLLPGGQGQEPMYKLKSSSGGRRRRRRTPKRRRKLRKSTFRRHRKH